jgi:hypothetical protein
MDRRRSSPPVVTGFQGGAPMFRLRTAFATLALIVGLGSTGHAQIFNQGPGGGFGYGGFSGGYGGFSGGYGVFQPGFTGSQFGVLGGPYPVPASPYGYGYGYGAPVYPAYGFWPGQPQTYNSMGSLMNSIQRSTSRRGGWW